MAKAYLVSVGNEILAGQTADTNAAWLAGRLLEKGIAVVGTSVVPDDIDAIKEALILGGRKAEVVLVTGGLGPTDDDITRDALAGFLRVELELREELVERIRRFFAKRGIEMAETNKRQGIMPVGTKDIPNDLGTACGILAEKDGKIFACMPGVPVEMRKMFDEQISGELAQLDGGEVVVVRKLRCFGTGESTIADLLGDMMKRNREPLVNCTVRGGVITLHMVARGKTVAEAEKLIEPVRQDIRERLGELVFGEDDQTLGQVVGELLAERGMTITVAESCTGGLVAKMLTDTPGSSRYFLSGWVTYSNNAKISELAVDARLIEQKGAVSAEVAAAMAQGARKRAGTDIGIGITGIAGPGGGTEQKPVGLVYISVDFRGDSYVERRVFSHTRELVRQRAAMVALDIVRRKLNS
ncbi:Nicotinamide-nucleotide amidohydrolase PncC [Anaerohalosphaera lusitana]|uniref:CinA-like protein n=1 Tax=Anaerohalosphaera lusitana TaxID=1936003 RepID=A0A1U9NL45_9BACT|nr:competence/damage-inducible protein A [Anaerohalosphaera lusitana]AQT68517.1 Nicotinamide-nucleotide amidohydrolase PncC [Anaerohalosphaera lusitana]